MTETKQQPRALVWKGMLGNKIVASLSHYMEACQDFFMEDLHFRGGLCRATWQDLPKSQIYQKYKIVRNPSSGDLSQRYLGQYPKWLTHNWSVVSCLREKVLSEHSHFHLWVVWGSFCVAMVELSSSTETVWTRVQSAYHLAPVQVDRLWYGEVSFYSCTQDQRDLTGSPDGTESVR